MNERRYAVLIASSQFPQEPKLQPLRCPENDVDGLNTVLTSGDRGEFTETLVLKNQPHYEILLKINQVLRKASKDDLIFIYYSGHGKLDLAGRLYLATVNTVIDALQATSIPVQNLRDNIDISPSRRIILVLDCCFSGAVEKAFLRSSLDDQLRLNWGGQGTFIMTASTEIQVAEEKESDQYAVFTKHIINGLQSGDADLDGDGQVSMPELYQYVHDRVKDEGFQEPMRWDLNVRGELIISRSGKTPREDRRNQLRELLLDLGKNGTIPDRILTKALDVNNLEPQQLVGVLGSYDALLERLLQHKIRPGEFIDEWIRLEQNPHPSPIKITTDAPRDQPPPKSKQTAAAGGGFHRPPSHAPGPRIQRMPVSVESTTISIASAIILTSAGLYTITFLLSELRIFTQGYTIFEEAVFSAFLTPGLLEILFGIAILSKRHWLKKVGIIAASASIGELMILSNLFAYPAGLVPRFGMLLSLLSIALLARTQLGSGYPTGDLAKLPANKRLVLGSLLFTTGFLFAIVSEIISPGSFQVYSQSQTPSEALTLLGVGVLEAFLGAGLILDASWAKKWGVIGSLIGFGLLPLISLDFGALISFIAFILLLWQLTPLIKS